MKPFNQRFVERVNSIFSELNNDSLANDGWQALKPRLNNPPSKKAMVIALVPFYAKAASIIILLGIGWVFNQQLVKNHSAQFPTRVVEVEPAQESPKTQSLQQTAPIQSKALVNSKYKVSSTYEPKDAQTSLYGENDYPQNTITSTTPTVELTAETDSISHTSDTSTVIQPALLLLNEPIPTGFYADIDEVSQTGKSTKRNELNIGISSMLALMDDVKTSTPGISVGVFSNHKISRKVYLSPGMKINVQDFNLPTIPQNRNADYLAGDVVTGDYANAQITSTEARIKVVSLEIPLNITVTLFQGQKHKLSLSTGLSSLAYIQQTFEQNYNIKKSENVFNQINNSWEQVTLNKSYNVSDEYGAFKRIDLFKLVNLSIGYEIPFRKNAITIEPFIQIPLGTVTSNDIYMGNGGLTVKYSLF
ncbi:hypothetical protein DSECCO2_105890 [anaerobic digester metagenome]